MRKPRRPNWVEDVPIYRQLMDVLVVRILDQVYLEDERGEGLMLRKGVRDILLRREKSRFMKDELPVLRSRLKRLGIDLRTLAGAFED